MAGARDEAQGIIVSDAIDQYIAAKTLKRNELSTIEATRSALTVLLDEHLTKRWGQIWGQLRSAGLHPARWLC
jgi:predicted nucleic acid-binding protein